MLQRVTHETIQRSTLRNLQTNMSALASLQGQMSSGKKIQVPSDDPSGTGQVLSLRATTSQLAQYQRNGQDGDSWLTTVDTALTTALGYLRNARDLVVQSGDAGLGQTSRNALADNIDGLKAGLLSQANARYQGRNVFAGTSDATGAFTVDTSGATPTYTWTGSATATVDRKVGPSTTVRVDTDGSQAFGWTDPSSGTQSTAFALLDKISTGLRNGTDVTGTLNDIDSVMQNVLTAAASNGSRQKVLESTGSDVTAQQLTVKGQLTGVEDVDMAEVIMNLQMQEVTYQGALAAGAKVLQPTLLDFLR
jgi:flagellar hook-associated protein 3 FlgL